MTCKEKSSCHSQSRSQFLLSSWVVNLCFLEEPSLLKDPQHPAHCWAGRMPGLPLHSVVRSTSSYATLCSGPVVPTRVQRGPTHPTHPKSVPETEDPPTSPALQKSNPGGRKSVLLIVSLQATLIFSYVCWWQSWFNEMVDHYSVWQLCKTCKGTRAKQFC